MTVCRRFVRVVGNCILRGVVGMRRQREAEQHSRLVAAAGSIPQVVVVQRIVAVRSKCMGPVV